MVIFARILPLSVGEGSTLGLKLDRAICDFCASFLSNNRESPRPDPAYDLAQSDPASRNLLKVIDVDLFIEVNRSTRLNDLFTS